MLKKYVIRLSEREREQLLELTQSGKAAAKKHTHARLLLKADCAEGRPGWSDERIREALDTSTATVARVRQLFVEQGLPAALERKSLQRPRRRRLDGVQEAHLIALACREPPRGHDHWTLRLLADKMVALEYVDELSYETVRRTLKKRTQALAEETVVHPAESERRVCLAHGRGARPIPTTL